MRLAARREDAKGPRRQISAEFYSGVRLRCILSRRSTVPFAAWDRLAAGSVTGAQPAADRDSREFLELGSLLAAVVSSR